MSATDIFQQSKEEVQRQQTQAMAWQDEAVRLLKIIGIKKGWNCVDLACGAMGILKPLSVMCGDNGKVTGVDMDDRMITAAAELVQEHKLSNVELRHGDLFNNKLPRNSFDFVHERFTMPYMNSESLLQEMIGLARLGGIVCAQEPDQQSWDFFPEFSGWNRFKPLLESAFASTQMNVNIGKEVFPLFQKSGLEDVRVHAAVIALSNSHPYMRMPIILMNMMKENVLGKKLMSENDFTDLVRSLENHIANPRSVMVTFTTIQVWGRKK